MKDVLSIILGGGRGLRLYPLTRYRAKPAVPLAGKYRLVDIPISNCLNSGFEKILVLTQFNSESLNKHIFRAYKLDTFSGGFVEIIAAEQSMEESGWFQGPADAVRRCFKHFNNPRIKYILILPADQLYKMDFNDLLDFHIEKKAEVTIACNPTFEENISDLGIMGVDKTFRIKDFIEKPGSKKDIKHLRVVIDGKETFLASMGIYVFNKDVLFDLLTMSNKADFGSGIIPEAIPQKVIYAYIYRGYWKDIGSISSFYKESLSFASPQPPLDLFDENWQFFTRPRYLPLSKIIDSHLDDSIIAEGSIIEKAKIKHSIVGLRSIIRAGSVIEESIIMGCDYYESPEYYSDKPGLSGIPNLGIGEDCHIQKAIIDKNARVGNAVKVINKDNVKEFENEYCVIRDGIVIIPKNTVIPSGTVI